MKNDAKIRKSLGLLAGLIGLAYAVLVFSWPAPVSTKEISGAEVYQANCGKCHSERYPSERTAEEWKLIVNHMRVIGGLTAKEAKAVLEYLQQNSADEQGGKS